MNIQPYQVYENKLEKGLKVVVTSVNNKSGSIYGVNNRDGRKLHYGESFLDYWELTDDVYTRVVFKLDHDDKSSNMFGDVFACLLDSDAKYGRVVDYAHVGQHGEANIDYVKRCRNATPDKYSGLKQELESIGYFLDVKSRIPANFVQGKSL